MLIFLNAGFGDPLSLDTCRDIKAMGFDGIRTDALYCGPHGQEPRLTALTFLDETAMNAREAGLQVQWLISRPLETGPVDIDEAIRRVDYLRESYPWTHSFDVGMEFNHSKARYQPSTAVELINACVGTAGSSIPVSACLTNNMGREALEFARQCLVGGLACYAIGLHPYKTTVEPWKPARGSGWSSREEEWQRWQELAGSQQVRLWAPEWGYHCGTSNVPVLGVMGKLGVKEKLSYTEDQQREFVAYELQDQRERGVEMTGVFQLNDAADSATNPNHEAHYGMRRADGSWKPVVEAIQKGKG